VSELSASSFAGVVSIYLSFSSAMTRAQRWMHFLAGLPNSPAFLFAFD
jgi:hypothetical protein